MAEKLIRTIAEKCLRKGLGIKVAHCAPRKRAKNLDPRERVGKIWRWCGELFAMRVLLRSSRSLSRMSVREVLAALDIQLRQPGQLCNNLLHEFLVRVGLGESAHILQVPGPKTAHFRKGLLKSSETRSMTILRR